MKKDHPDQVDTTGEEIKGLASSLTLFRTKARDLLTDAANKIDYDETLKSWDGLLIGSFSEHSKNPIKAGLARLISAGDDRKGMRGTTRSRSDR